MPECRSPFNTLMINDASTPPRITNIVSVGVCYTNSLSNGDGTPASMPPCLTTSRAANHTLNRWV